jgi:hypothetical protein
LGQRSRKRGRRQKPAVAVAVAPRPSRSEQKNAAARATLTPLRPGERPWPIVVAAVLAAAWGAVNLGLFLAGVKLKSSGLHASLGQTMIFTVLMTVCAVGMWKMRYWAVLGFMALLAILLTAVATALLVRSNVVGALIAVPVVVAGGYLFFKLVRVLSRIQMPKYPGSR